MAEGVQEKPTEVEQEENGNIPMHSVLQEKAILNEGSEDELVCYGYKRSTWKTVVCCILGVLSFGLLVIIFRWKPSWHAEVLYVRCNLHEAQYILLKDIYKRWHLSRVKTEEVEIPSEKTPQEEFTSKVNGGPNPDHVPSKVSTIKYFVFQKMKFLWEANRNTFEKLRGLDVDVPMPDFYTKFHGLNAKEQQRQRNLYGINEIHITLRSIPVLFFQEALNPFYVFQIYSVCLWIFGYSYYYFSAAIISMSLISIALTVYSTRKQSIALREMVSTTNSVTVYRGEDVYREMDDTELVPGDMIEIPRQGCLMTCDAVLISGNCIVNESMLTGESTPITKTPLPNNAIKDQPDSKPECYCSERHKRHTLFSGTKVLQSRRFGKRKVMAVVVNTGYNTAKGALVHSILFPKPMNVRLHRDAIRFVAVLACIAFVGFIYVIAIKVLHHADTKDIVLKALDIFTIAVSPALPAALTIGLVYAQQRLKDLGIFCISPQRINLGGMMDVVCFDKTGTLTEDHLELLAVSPVKTDSFVIVEDAGKLPFGPFVAGMATCHSLTVIDDQIRGDPLDVQMFQSVKWSIREPSEGEPPLGFSHFMPTIVRSPSFQDEDSNDNIGHTAKLDGGVKQGDGMNTPIGNSTDAVPSQSFKSQGNLQEIGIVRQFPFSSVMQRMSVITQTKSTSHMEVYVKGAPETISRLCDQSTVPEEFQTILKEHTQNGLRVLAIAWKPLDTSVTYEQANKIERVEVENNLRMLGLLILQNTLKPETAPVIKQLKDANLRTIMVTGDNKLTAIHVARACGMIAHSEPVVEVVATPPSGDRGHTIRFRPVMKPGEVNRPASPEHHKMNGQVDEDDVALTIDEGEEINVEILNHNNYHLALDGKTFAVLMEHAIEIVPKIAAKGTVFARMSPDQKAQLVEQLQELEYYVGMCGDGANDCGALKAAHAGISLSEAEASVASPFTSCEQNIKCVPTLIREGRAALVTSFGVFKYMALYSMIQFASIIILNTVDLFPSDPMFMYWDIAITTVVAILIARNQAYTKISIRKPLNNLTDPSMLFSVFIHIIFQFLVQLIAYIVLRQQPWFVPYVKEDDHSITYAYASEASTIFFISNFQYLIVAFIFSKGPPFRKPIYTNVLFSVSLVILTLFSLFLVLVPVKKIYNYFQLVEFDWMFRCIIIALAMAHFLAAILIENFLADTRVVKDYTTCRKARKGTKVTKHEKLIQELNTNPDWPPISALRSSADANGQSGIETDV